MSLDHINDKYNVKIRTHRKYSTPLKRHTQRKRIYMYKSK